MLERRIPLKRIVLLVLSIFLLCVVQAEATESEAATLSSYNDGLHIGEYKISVTDDYTSESSGTLGEYLKSGTVRVEFLNSSGNVIPSSNGAAAVRLILTNVYIYKYTRGQGGCPGIWSELPLVIDVRGSNNIKFNSAGGISGISCDKEIEFTGDGDLYVTADLEYTYQTGSTASSGIMTWGGDITFRGSGHIKAMGYRTGISANGKLNFNLGKGGSIEGICSDSSRGLSAFVTENKETNTINFAENNAITSPEGGGISKYSEAKSNNSYDEANDPTNTQAYYVVVDKDGKLAHSATVANTETVTENNAQQNTQENNAAENESENIEPSNIENNEETTSNGETVKMYLQPDDEIVFDPQHPFDYNLEVIINQPGTYTISGSTSTAHITIGTGGSGTARVILDGAEITPGSNAKNGKGTAGITITDDGGTVELVSKTGKTNYITGYKLHPAIEKSGINTKLIFDSETSGASGGTIKAQSSSSSSAPAIGGISGECCGNISFKAGTVEAWGGEGPGIGASQEAKKLDNITFDGASVTAVGTSRAPGIGTNECIEIGSITINSGVVRATATKGAGIGGGGAYLSKEGKQANIDSITINGGTVEATSTGGCAGIGSGAYNFVKQITINGGTVTAKTSGQLSTKDGFSDTSGACAIGGAGVFSYGRCTHITINGGKVSATAEGTHGCGIGPGYNAVGWNTINITGGSIKPSSSANDGMPIGGTKYSSSHTTYLNVNISGGTIDATTSTGQKSIGTFDSQQRPLKIQVTGGSFNGTNTAVTPVNDDDEKLTCAVINLNNIDVGSEATLNEIKHIVADDKYEDYKYGNNDIKTLAGSVAGSSTIYAWLPISYTYADKATATVDDGSGSKVIKNMYGYSYSSFAGFRETTFKEGTTVTLKDVDTTATAMADGSALCGYNQKKADVLSAPTKTGYHTTDYYKDQDCTIKVMNADGSFVKGVNGYTDQFGNWIYDKTSLTLYTKSVVNKYTVKYDANVPDGVSTEVSGSMADQEFTYGETQELRDIWNDGAYSLPGYYLAGWTVNPEAIDDQGSRKVDYTNRQRVSDLTRENNGVVTLYAQWVPLHYYVQFSGGEGTGSMSNIELTFDKTTTLPANTFTKEASIFAGWKRDEVGSTLFADRAKVENLLPASQLSERWEAAHTTARGSSEDEPTIATIMSKYNDTQVSKDESIYMTLTAQWKTDYAFEIQILIDDQIPGESAAQTISLKTENTAGATPAYKELTELYDGYGYIDNVDPGTYYIFVNGKATNKKWSTDGKSVTGMVFLQYYSYSVTRDSNVGNASIKLAQGSPASPFVERKNVTLVGGEVEVSASDFAEGYMFDMWNSLAVDPDNYNGNTAGQNPVTFTIAGPTSLRAESKKIEKYTVVYDANDGSGKTVSSEESIGVGSVISQCDFTRLGYYFKNWNTKADGSGTSYKAGQEFLDIAEAEDKITLYAIWSRQAPTPSIIKGNGQTVTEGTNKALSFTSDAEIEQFIEVKLNGTHLSDDKYDIEEGSTIIKLKPEFVSSLSPGKYILSIVSEGGSADAEFTISAAETKTDTKDNTKTDTKDKAKDGAKKHGNGSTDTGDTNNVLIYVVLGLTALLGSILVLIARRKIK